MARYCTTTAYRRLFRDSPSSLNTLWSDVIKSSSFSARGTASPVRLLQRALVILVRKQTSQFRSFGKWVWTLCFLDFDATVVGRSEPESWEMCADAGTFVSSRLSVNGHPNLDCHSSFYFCFWVSGLSRTSSPLLLRHFALVLDLEMYIKMNLTSPGGDVEDDLAPELDDNPGTTRGTKFSVM